MSWQKQRELLDEDGLFSGFIAGMLIGSALALFSGIRLPANPIRRIYPHLKHVGQSASSGDSIPPQKSSKAQTGKLPAAALQDAVGQSQAEGRNAARRRRAELGLSDS